MDVKICKNSRCDKPLHARGYCQKHYRKHLAAVRPKKCSIEDCDGDVQARGYCPAHYQKWRDYGDPLAGVTQRDLCAICNRAHYALGLCRRHYNRFREFGDPWFDGRNYPECGVSGCPKRKFGHGYCKAHYDRWRYHGDPLGGPPSLWHEELPIAPLLEAVEEMGGFKPLLHRLDLDATAQERMLRRWERAKGRGWIDLLYADEFACKVLRTHPALIWPDHYWQFDDDPEEAMAA